MELEGVAFRSRQCRTLWFACIVEFQGALRYPVRVTSWGPYRYRGHAVLVLREEEEYLIQWEDLPEFYMAYDKWLRVPGGWRTLSSQEFSRRHLTLWQLRWE